MISNKAIVLNGSSIAGSTGLAIYVPEAREVSAADLDSYRDALAVNAEANQQAGGKSWSQFVQLLITGNNGQPGQTQTSGAFSYYITWDNPAVDLDLVVNEPRGEWAGPADGATSANGYSSSDSYYSGEQKESYTTNQQLEKGQYDVFVQYAGCSDGYDSCGNTVVKVYRNDPQQDGNTYKLVATRPMSATPAAPAPSAYPAWSDFIADVAADHYGDWLYGSTVTRALPASRKAMPHAQKQQQKSLRMVIHK